MNLEQLRQVYDQRAPTYDRTVGFSERLIVGSFRREFAEQLRGDTLEVAIGTGLNLPHYPGSVTSITGVDLSTGMLCIARARADELHRPITLIQANAAQLPFPNARFDTVGMALSLCTVDDPPAVLRELIRVCRPGGRIVLLEHTRSSARPILALQRLIAPLQARAIGCHLTRDTVRSVRRTGLPLTHHRHRLFNTVHLLVLSKPQPAESPISS